MARNHNGYTPLADARASEHLCARLPRPTGVACDERSARRLGRWFMLRGPVCEAIAIGIANCFVARRHSLARRVAVILCSGGQTRLREYTSQTKLSARHRGVGGGKE